LAPHLCKQNSNQWFDLKKEGPISLLSRAMKKQELIPIKLEELNTLGSDKMSTPGIEEYVAAPEKIWDSIEECEETLKNVTTPVCLMFGTDDILFLDHFDSNIKALMTIQGCKCIILQGERHLMEIDCPDRVVSEACFFIDESRKNYTHNLGTVGPFSDIR
jgi:pimeloyl-ACP methyl ester carboxylesterase